MLFVLSHKYDDCQAISVTFFKIQFPMTGNFFFYLTLFSLRGFSYSKVSQEGKYRIIDELTVLQLKTLLWNGLNSCRQQQRGLVSGDLRAQLRGSEQ